MSDNGEVSVLVVDGTRLVEEVRVMLLVANTVHVPLFSGKASSTVLEGRW